MSNLVWLDIETTGLDPIHNLILEVGIAVTDIDLNILAEDSAVLKQNPISLRDDLLANEFVKNMHTVNGLLDEVERAELSYEDVQQRMLTFLKDYVGHKEAPLAGSTISFDRSFLSMQMPELEDYFHYRNIDVSTLRELSRRWYPELPEFPKRDAHRSIPDIYQSIDALKYYRDNVFKER